MKGKTMFDSEESQKKICRFFRNLCFVSTIIIAVFILSALWIGNVNDETFTKALLSYGVILVSSLIIQKIFTESNPKTK